MGIDSFGQYYDYVSDPRTGTGELPSMIDVVTTNKTEFFRESKHLDFLLKKAMPGVFQSRSYTGGRKIDIWSAGCSTGEEPYSLAMILADFISEGEKFDFTILATDVSGKVLDIAERGIYDEERVNPVPPTLKRKYLMRGKGPKQGLYRIVPELRRRITFQRLNFMQGDFGIRPRMDIIFCRNVVIYFERKTQVVLFNKIFDQLKQGGYLFIGHSETLHGINDRFVQVGTSIYRKP